MDEILSFREKQIYTPKCRHQLDQYHRKELCYIIANDANVSSKPLTTKE